MGTSFRHQDGNSPCPSPWDLKVSIPAPPQPRRAQRKQHLSMLRGVHCPEPTPCCLISRSRFHYPKYVLEGSFSGPGTRYKGDWK